MARSDAAAGGRQLARRCWSLVSRTRRISHHPLAFLCIPALVWAAFRFGPRETAASMLVLSAVVGGNNGLLVLQAFMATTAVTALAMAALVRERRTLLGAEQERRVGAERTSRAKDEFLAMLGHELRNPLLGYHHGPRGR